MVILHICSISNDYTSGISNVVPEYYMQQKKFCDVALLNCNKISIEKLRGEKNVFYYYQIPDRRIFNLKEPFCNPDLVIFHGIYFIEYIFIYRELLKHNIPYIIIPHGSLSLEAQRIKKIKKKISNYLLFDKFIYNANKVQFLSSLERKASNRYAVNSFVCGNGINSTSLYKHKFKNDEINIIYVGRYALYTKGLDIIIKCVKDNKVFFEENRIKINLYGSGYDGKNKIDKLINCSGTNTIIKTNDAVFAEEKWNKIIDNDAFIQLSRHEGQPLGIMEAMLLGMPIIASEGSNFGDIIKRYKCGYVANNENDLINVFKSIIKSKNILYEYSKNSRNYANNNFVWDKILPQMLNEYKNVVEECS